MDTSVWGQITVRPVKVGLAIGIDASVPSLETCFELATSSWGGALYPIIPVDVLEEGLAQAEFFDVDVIHSPDDDAVATEASKATGFQWVWMSTSPFESSDEIGNEAVLGMDSVIHAYTQQDTEFSPVLVTWDSDHPLGLLNGAMFGRYADDSEGIQLSSRFASAASSIHLGSGDSLPVLADLNPLTATRFDLHPKEPSTVGIAVVDPSNPQDVIDFWNHRALGHDVVPWPLEHESLAEDLVGLWLEDQRDHWPTVFDDRPGLTIFANGSAVPDSLTDFLDERIKDEVARVIVELRTHSASADHSERLLPIEHASRSFDVTLGKDAWQFEVVQPAIEFLPRRFWSDRHGIVAAEVVTASETNLRPGRKASAPSLRMLTPSLRALALPMVKFIRPIYNGLVMGVQASDHLVNVPLISSTELIRGILKRDGWSVGQSDSGRYVARFIEVLGGAHSDSAANQPAVRAVLDAASRSPYGKPAASLVRTAEDNRGDWPRFAARADEYPKSVVQRMTSIEALRARVKIRCLSCGTFSSLSADELSADVACSLCGDTFPLGLVLTVDKPSWLLTTASVLERNRLRETYPIMATLSVFSSMTEFGSQLPHHVIGATFEHGDFSCEADIVLLLQTYERPVLVIGEAKSFLDELDDDDIMKLTTVRDAVRNSGLDCQVLFATLRESLTDNEIALLRCLADETPPALRMPRHTAAAPLLPIVFTASSLSLETYNDDHPSRLARGSVQQLAVESSKRELGFQGFALASATDPASSLVPVWDDGE